MKSHPGPGQLAIFKQSYSVSCNDMKTYSALLALCEVIHWLPLDSPHKGPVMWSFDVFFVVNCKSCWAKSWVARIWDTMMLMWCDQWITNTHYSDMIMSAMASQITSLMIVHSTVYSGADQRKHQSSAWLDFVRGIHRWPVNSPHKGPVMQKMFPFDDVIIGGILPSCP